MDPLSLILGLGQLVPGLLRWAHKDNAAEVAQKALSIGARLTGKENPQDIIESVKANPQLLIDFQRESSALLIAEMDNETRRLEAINATMRTEYTSGDPYVRRARPTFIYSMAVTWTIQAIGLLVGAILRPDLAAAIITASSGLTTMWGVALAVIGVTVKARSDDKARALGKDAPSMLDALARAFGRK